MTDQKKAPKKQNPAAIVTTLICLLAGAAAGLLGGMFVGDMAGENDTLFFLYLGVLLISLVVAYFAQIIVHEGGHLVCGLMSGYSFVSFNILGFVWQRGEDGKLHLGRMQIAGAGGQCMMAPPEYNGGDFPYMLYNLGGVLANLFSAAVFALLAWLIPLAPVRILLVCLTIVGAILGPMNIIPFANEAIQNDGKNILCIRRSIHARRAFWVQMKLAAEVSRGVRVRDLPAEWFAPFPDAELDNPIVCAIPVLNTSRLMDMQDFPAALEAIRALMARKKGVVGLYRTTMACDGAVCELLSGQPGEFTAMLEEPAHQQIMKAMADNPSILRTQYAIALLRDGDQAKANQLLAAFRKAAANHAYPAEADSEREFLSSSLQQAMPADFGTQKRPTRLSCPAGRFRYARSSGG